MALTIKQATWGDEAATTDVTKSIREKSLMGYIDMVADPSIVSSIPLNSDTTVSLTAEDKKKALDFAVTQCGGGNDKKCIEERTASYEATALQTRVAGASSSKNIISGRRLTVTFVDGTGREKTLQIPDGQKLQIGKAPAIQTDKLAEQVKTTGLYILMTALWVFSVIIVYRTLIAAGWVTTGYALTAVAVLIPYSGLLITPIAFAVINYIGKTNIAMA
jgi:hypothetical protein